MATPCPRCGHRNPHGQRDCLACTLELTPTRTRRQFWLALVATVLVAALLLFLGMRFAPQIGAELVPQSALAPPVPAPTALAAGNGAAPIETQQATERDQRRVTATAASLKATADVAQVRTSIAQQTVSADQQRTAVALTPTSRRSLDLFELPLYPGAQPIDPNDPLWRGQVRTNEPTQGGYGQLNQQVYTIPTGDPSSAVLTYYQQTLALDGWQATNTNAVQAVGTQQHIFVRDRQQLIVTLVTVPNTARLADVTALQETTYLLITLVTR